MILQAKHLLNGNVHSNSDVAAYLDKLDVRGKLETTGKVVNYNNGVTQYIKKENAPERVLIDPSKYIVDSLGANPTVHENWQTYSNPTVENTTPIQAKSGLQFCASVIKLKNTIMSNDLDVLLDAYGDAESGNPNIQRALAIKSLLDSFKKDREGEAYARVHEYFKDYDGYIPVIYSMSVAETEYVWGKRKI